MPKTNIKTKKMLLCAHARSENIFFGRPKRSVFFRDTTGKYKPLEGLYEFQQSQAAEGIKVEHRPFYNFHGLNISDNQALEGARLQIREDIERRIEYEKPLKGSGKSGERKAGLQVLDERVTQQLRRVMARELNVERQKMGYVAKKWEIGKGFMRNVAEATKAIWVTNFLSTPLRGALNVVGLNKAAEALRIRNEDEVGAKVEEVYGPEVNVEERRIKLAQDVWSKVTNPAHRAAISTELLNRGVNIPAARGTIPGQILQLAEADAEQLMEMRVALSTAPNAVFPSIDLKNNPLFPMSEKEPPGHEIDRLIQLRQIEMRERTKLLSTTIYDPQRLQHFLDMMQVRHKGLHELLGKILKDHALHPLENHEEAQALVAYLEYRWQRRGPDDLKKELENIQKRLPDVHEDHHGEKKDEHKDAHGHKEESEAQKLEKAKGSLKKMQDVSKLLKREYAQAASIGQAIYESKVELEKIRNAAATGGAGGKKGESGPAVSKDKYIEGLQDKKRELLLKIQDQEATFRDGSFEMLGVLNEMDSTTPIKPGKKPPAGDKRKLLFQFYTKLEPLKTYSTDEEVFGDTNPVAGAAGKRTSAVSGSKYSQLITQDFSDSQVTALQKEMDEHYSKKTHKKERLTPRQLLSLFKTNDLFRQGETNPEKAMRLGRAAANLMIADADHERMLKVFRQTNQELSERLGATTLGSRRLHRLGKWLAAKTNTGGVYEAEDIINYISGFDKEFAMFKDMKRDITITEFRDLLEKHGGMDPLKLAEFAQKLIEVYHSFQVLNTDGKIELWENHAVDMEELIGMILTVSMVLRSEQMANKLRTMDGDPFENYIKETKTEETTALKQEKDLLGKLSDTFADWKQLFSKKVLKHKYLGQVKEAMEEMSAKNMNYKERKAFLAEKGLLTPFNALAKGIIADRAFDLGKSAAGWTWTKLKGGGKFTYETGADALGGAWRDVVKPIGKAGKFVLWDVPTAPLRFGYHVTKKVVTFPFSLANRIFKWAKGSPSAARGHGGGHAAASAHH